MIEHEEKDGVGIDDDGKGLRCSRCGCRHHTVVYTRPTKGGLRRRRKCRNCGKASTTVERAVEEAA